MVVSLHFFKLFLELIFTLIEICDSLLFIYYCLFSVKFSDQCSKLLFISLTTILHIFQFFTVIWCFNFNFFFWLLLFNFLFWLFIWSIFLNFLFWFFFWTRFFIIVFIVVVLILFHYCLCVMCFNICFIEFYLLIKIIITIGINFYLI